MRKPLRMAQCWQSLATVQSSVQREDELRCVYKGGAFSDDVGRGLKTFDAVACSGDVATPRAATCEAEARTMCNCLPRLLFIHFSSLITLN